MSRRLPIAPMLMMGAVISGCTTLPPADVTTPSATLPTAPVDPTHTQVLESAYRERAAALMQDRRWADALVQLELLTLLRPDVQEYRSEIEQIHKRITRSVAEILEAADLARRRGSLDQATLQYLRVLSLDRDNVRAAQGLREIERERTRRAYLNRPPRNSM